MKYIRSELGMDLAFPHCDVEPNKLGYILRYCKGDID